MDKDHVTPEILAQMGEGSWAYVRELASEDLQKIFPDAPKVEPGLKIFALLSAAGEPILLADSRDLAVAGALQQHLQPVSVH